ncbi:homing endonuclease associated repeat-containing protein [Shimazuella kribbensis]|uniref:homing endonuclease associated repeat-containing protein n=1 Tax=Shimazuella kribbensis TaxID=139808 RepID=UPI00041A0C36|nr:hypothetical protein [Shimazuella kribbensis]
MNKPKYTNDDLITIIQKKAKELGRTPKKKELKQTSAIVARFGSWAKAIEIAQLKRSSSKKYTDQDLINALLKGKKIIEDKGYVFSINSYKKLHDFPSYGTYMVRFGSWNNALKKAGIATKRDRKWGDLSNDELLHILRTIAKDSSVLTMKVLKSLPDVPPVDVYIMRFNSWNKAIEKAGLESNKAAYRKYTDKDLLDSLAFAKNVIKDRLTIVKYKQMQKEFNLPSVSIYSYRFGSWSKALRKIQDY